MELLIFSDSHGRADRMQTALEAQIKRPDMILHLGDGNSDLAYLQCAGIPTLGVRGNCDWSAPATLSEEFLLTEYGHRILLVHGHRYGVKSGIGALLSYAVGIDADIVLFGHTHCAFERCIPTGETVGARVLQRPLYLFNPGSIGRGEGSFGTLALFAANVLLSHGSIH